MLSPHEILTTIKSLHKKHGLDFNDLTPENYNDFCSQLINSSNLCSDMKIYAFYTQAFSCNNIHVCNYLERFIQLATQAKDFDSIIELDNILYPDNHFFTRDQECVLSGAMNKNGYWSNPNPYTKHHHRKYYSFDKFSELVNSTMELGFSRNTEFILSDVLNGTLMGFTKHDIEHLKKIVYSPLCNLMLVKPTEVYMMNPEQLGQDPAYKRSVTLYYDLMGEGLISADMAALTLCFGGKQLFEFMLSVLDEDVITSIGRTLFTIVDSYKNRSNAVDDITQRIDRFMELATQQLLKAPVDVIKLSRMIGEESIPSIKEDSYRNSLLSHIANVPGIGMDSLRAVLSLYGDKHLSLLANDMRACPALASLMSELPSPMRRRLLESDLSL